MDESRLLREMLKKAINKTEGLQVVGEVERVDQLTEKIVDFHPDWLILFHHTLHDMPGFIENLMLENLDIRIAILSDRGQQVRVRYLDYQAESRQDVTWSTFSQSLREERAGKQI